MKTYSTLSQATSRILAVLVVAVPLAYLTFSYATSLAQTERNFVARLSYQELLDYVREGQPQSMAEVFSPILIALAIGVALVEAVALAIRWVFGLITSDALSVRPSITPGREAAVAKGFTEWEQANGQAGNRSGVMVS